MRMKVSLDKWHYKNGEETRPSTPGRYAVLGTSPVEFENQRIAYISTDFILLDDYFGPETDLDDEIPEIIAWISLDDLKNLPEYNTIKIIEGLRKSKISLYEYNKKAKIGDPICCAWCGKDLVKSQWSQAFCSEKCKDYYWNKVRSKNGL